MRLVSSFAQKFFHSGFRVLRFRVLGFLTQGLLLITGTKLKYKPGTVMGGKYLVHDCGLSRSIGYFLEPLIVLGLFGKKPLSIRLKGIVDWSNPLCQTFFLHLISFS